MELIILNLLLLFSFQKPVPEITLEQLQSKVMHQNNDTLYVVNFWATWCKPCVAELPFFEEVAEQFKNKKVKVLLVSLDFIREKQKVDRFVEDRGIKSEVVILNAGNPNVWIDKIEKEWGGAIPATLFYKGGEKQYFREGQFEKAELNDLIKTYLSK